MDISPAIKIRGKPNTMANLCTSCKPPVNERAIARAKIAIFSETLKLPKIKALTAKAEKTSIG